MFRPLMTSGNKRALIVDDEETLRMLVSMALKHFGFSTVTAASVNEAIAVLEAAPDISLVISDIVMPGQSGDCLVRWVQKNRPEIRLILMSGTEERLDPSVLFLQKPFTLSELKKALERVFRADSSMRPK